MINSTDILVALQVLLAASVAPLYVAALRTSRSRRSSHARFATLAAMLLALALALTLLAGVLLMQPAEFSEGGFDPVLLFGPPGITTLLALLVMWRSLRPPPPRLPSLRRHSH